MQSQWRLVWGIPSVLAIVQSLLVVFVFNFETPYHLKKTEQWEKLEQLMALIYHKSHVQARIDVIDTREVVGVEF